MGGLVRCMQLAERGASAGSVAAGAHHKRGSLPTPRPADCPLQADHVVSAGGERLRRRHDKEGHMVYWLQSPAEAEQGG
jgi:hypothetical protein